MRAHPARGQSCPSGRALTLAPPARPFCGLPSPSARRPCAFLAAALIALCAAPAAASPPSFAPTPAGLGAALTTSTSRAEVGSLDQEELRLSPSIFAGLSCAPPRMEDRPEPGCASLEIAASVRRASLSAQIPAGLLSESAWLWDGLDLHAAAALDISSSDPARPALHLVFAADLDGVGFEDQAPPPPFRRLLVAVEAHLALDRTRAVLRLEGGARPEGLGATATGFGGLKALWSPCPEDLDPVCLDAALGAQVFFDGALILWDLGVFARGHGIGAPSLSVGMWLSGAADGGPGAAGLPLTLTASMRLGG